ncbi:MAG: hypothetical protein COT84_03180 [Chlamydiae bacterium CG10_big_fil_rev_8_21_14_0_10_35_9]|nr:MAG: hypothetical protein COT84_03180 [Chlamydiae bacterium CG10_big_fil_rev_8_21_14_0_10_35_9]
MKKSIILLFLIFNFSRVSLSALQEEPFISSESYSRHIDKITSNTATADNKSFNYTSIAVALPIPIPGVQVGHRKKFNSNAIDFSGTFSTIIVSSGLSANCSYIKYLNKNNYYLRGGAGVAIAFAEYTPVNYGIFPNISFGKESEKSFYQIEASMVSFLANGVEFIPAFSYQYGFKF